MEKLAGKLVRPCRAKANSAKMHSAKSHDTCSNISPLIFFMYIFEVNDKQKLEN